MWQTSIFGIDMYHLFYYFFIYSFLGWISECVKVFVETKKLVNRGFISGPICPIYGVGAVALVLLLGSVKNIFLLFLIGVVVTSVLEYVTGYILEKLFHSKWWDYSDKPFNLQGRICLFNSLLWGVSSIVIVKFIQPLMEKLVNIIPSSVGEVFGVIILILFTLDEAHAIYTALNLNLRLKSITQISEEIKLRAENIKSHKLPTAAEELQIILSNLTERYENLLSKRIFSHNRLIKAFPRLKSIHFESTLDEVKKRATIKKKAATKKKVATKKK